MADLKRIQEALGSVHHCFRYEDPLRCPETLLEALQAELQHIDPESWEERMNFGGLFVNGRAALADRSLSVPCQIEYYEPKYKLKDAASQFPEFNSSLIVFEDEDLIAAFKPAGLPSLPPRDQKRFHLKGYLEQHIGHVIHMPSRLDRSTCGIIIASKSARMNAALQKLFEHRQIQKFYLLEVCGKPGWETTEVTELIGRSSEHSILRSVVKKGGQPAQTVFNVKGNSETLDSSGKTHSTTLIEAQPLTGRTHQIRVHIEHLGFPIVGDNFYDGLRIDGPLHLMAQRLEFIHPFTNEPTILKVPDNLLPEWTL